MTTLTDTFTPAPATADVMRMVTLPLARLEAREDEDGDGRLLTGLAAVFNRWTEIDSWFEGHFLERVSPGAFSNTLAKRGDRIKVLFNHGFDPSIGDKPLGKPSRMEETDEGLWTETPMARTSYNDDLIELLRSGAIDGMSFRFKVTEEEWKKSPDPSDDNPAGLKERTIKAVDLYEFGPVTFPAYEATTAGVRSADVFRVWQQTNRFLLPTDAGPLATVEAEIHEDDSRAEELPVGLTKQERQRLARRFAPDLKELTL